MHTSMSLLAVLLSCTSVVIGSPPHMTPAQRNGTDKESGILLVDVSLSLTPLDAHELSSADALPIPDQFGEALYRENISYTFDKGGETIHCEWSGLESEFFYTTVQENATQPEDAVTVKFPAHPGYVLFRCDGPYTAVTYQPRPLRNLTLQTEYGIQLYDDDNNFWGNEIWNFFNVPMYNCTPTPPAKDLTTGPFSCNRNAGAKNSTIDQSPASFSIDELMVREQYQGDKLSGTPQVNVTIGSNFAEVDNFTCAGDLPTQPQQTINLTCDYDTGVAQIARVDDKTNITSLIFGITALVTDNYDNTSAEITLLSKTAFDYSNPHSLWVKTDDDTAPDLTTEAATNGTDSDPGNDDDVTNTSRLTSSPTLFHAPKFPNYFFVDLTVRLAPNATASSYDVTDDGKTTANGSPVASNDGSSSAVGGEGTGAAAAAGENVGGTGGTGGSSAGTTG